MQRKGAVMHIFTLSPRETEVGDQSELPSRDHGYHVNPLNRVEPLGVISGDILSENKLG